jgi:hypothetical protein
MNFLLMMQGLLSLYGDFAKWWLVFGIVGYTGAGLATILLYQLRNFMGRW